MIKYKNTFFWLVLVGSILFIYGRWLLPGDLTWGDWSTWPKAALLEWRQFNIWWDQTTLGRSFLDLGSALWAPFFWLGGQLAHFLNLPFNVISRILWYGPFIFFSLISMPIFWKEIISKSSDGWFIATFLYTINTYALLLTMGGHISVAMVLAMAPLLVAISIKAIRSKQVVWILTSTLLWIIASYYEPRITLLVIFLTLVSACIFLTRKNLWRTFIIFGWYGLSLVLAHLWWVIPLLTQKSNTLIPSTHLSVDKSYIDFTHALLLYHPQWPNNVLGQINSVPIIYVVFPVMIIIVNWLAWKKNQFKKTIAILSLLYLLGAFLSKGDNPPFGGIYHFLFDHFVFFKPFRDASKFMLFLMFASSIIIGLGFHLWQTKSKVFKTSLGLLAAIAYLLIIFVPALELPTMGTFSAKTKPQAYKEVDRIIKDNQNFSRTIWMPRPSRFSFFSSQHPNINLTETLYNDWVNFTSNAGESINFISSPIANLMFDTASVQYLAIPYDSENDIYKDYKPQKEYIAAASSASWLKLSNNGNVKMFENSGYYPKISISNNLNVLSSYDLYPEFLDQHLIQDKYPSYIFSDQKSDKLAMPQPTNLISGLEDIKTINATTYQAKLPIYLSGEYNIEKAADISSIHIGNQVVADNRTYLKAGKHDVVIYKNITSLPQQNLFLDQSIYNCGSSNDVAVFNQTYYDERQIQLLSNGHVSCMAIELSNLTPGRQYEFLLKGDLVGSGKFTIKSVTDSGDNKATDYEYAQDEANYSTYLQFKTVKNVQSATLFLQIVGENAKMIVNQLNLIGPINQLSPDSVLLLNTSHNSTDAQQVQPKITQESPSHYQVSFFDVRHPFYLNLSTTYHPNWQASIINNNKAERITQHFIQAGWANGWQVNKTGDFIIDIVFTPLDSFNRWKYVSLSWLMILFGLLLLSTIARFKKYKPKAQH